MCLSSDRLWSSWNCAFISVLWFIVRNIFDETNKVLVFISGNYGNINQKLHATKVKSSQDGVSSSLCSYIQYCYKNYTIKTTRSRQIVKRFLVKVKAVWCSVRVKLFTCVATFWFSLEIRNSKRVLDKTNEQYVNVVRKQWRTLRRTPAQCKDPEQPWLSNSRDWTSWRNLRITFLSRV